MVPIIIGFLVSVIGPVASARRSAEIVQKLREAGQPGPDFVIKTGLKLAGPVIRGIAGSAPG